MRLGKLDNDQLQSLILDKFTHRRAEVVCSPSVGVDCAAVDTEGQLAVLSTDPITSAGDNIGALTVHVCCNDAAAAGAEPLGMLVTLLAPPDASEEQIGRVADELALAAEQANIEIIGGHTEVTDAVTRMVTCGTVLARVKRDGIITSAGMRPGDDIVLTKNAGLEGTAIIASDFAPRLAQGGITADELDIARGFYGELSVVKEGLYAAEHGAAAMHDVTEGGVLGAVWEMAYASGCGAELKKSDIPVHDVTKRICAVLGLNEYRLLSSGCMLIACADGRALVEGLGALGIKAAVIGRATAAGADVLCDGAQVAPPGADELYKLF